MSRGHTFTTEEKNLKQGETVGLVLCLIKLSTAFRPWVQRNPFSPSSSEPLRERAEAPDHRWGFRGKGTWSLTGVVHWLMAITKVPGNKQNLQVCSTWWHWDTAVVISKFILKSSPCSYTKLCKKISCFSKLKILYWIRFIAILGQANMDFRPQVGQIWKPFWKAHDM